MKTKDLSDKILWDAIKYRSDKAALEALFNRYYAKLHDFSRSLVQDHAEAAEIAADVFVNIWEKRADFDISDLKAYLFMSVKNRSFNFLKNKKQIIDFEDIDDLSKEVISDYHDPFQLLCEIENNQFLNHLIDQLPRKRKVIFKLCRDEGFKYREIAEMLEISVRTVEDQMMQALKTLRAAALANGVSYNK